MGRPLKINKAPQTGSSPNFTGGIDIGFPNFGSLTVPVVNSANTLNTTQFLGVVGGSNTVDTATYPTVQVRVFITGLSEEDGYIIRQKGSHKYLVGGNTARTALIQGISYRITAVGNTDWTAYGVGTGGAAIGTIFTATAALADTGTGAVNGVGVCILTSDLSPTAGLMSISYTPDNSSEIAISKLTNKFVLDWTNFKNAEGTALTTYADTGNNEGVVNYVGEGSFVANFFTDEGTVTKSGAEAATAGTGTSGALFNSSGNSSLVIVQNYNS